MQEYEWNKPERLPPVACPLVINVNGRAVRATRISHISDKNGQMDYLIDNGSARPVEITGRFPWSYP